MRQQINLFATLARPSRYYLTESLIFQIFGGFLILLAAVSIIQIILLQVDKYHLQSLQKTYIEKQAILAKVFHSADEENNDRISKEIIRKTRLLQTLQERKITTGQCTLLSNYFTSLAEMNISGLWFTKIYVNLSNDEILLSGMTYAPVLLMQWVENLDKTPCFSRREFGPLKLSKEEPKTSTTPDSQSLPAKPSEDFLHFTINSKIAGSVASAETMSTPDNELHFPINTAASPLAGAQP